MDVGRILKMSNDELQKEINARQRKISSLKSEISLLKRLIKGNSENSNFQKSKNGFFANGESRFPDISEDEIDEMINMDKADFKAQP